jgi:hypothetical protein
MIELTEQQMRALENTKTTLPRVVNPRTKETFVLVRADTREWTAADALWAIRGADRPLCHIEGG